MKILQITDNALIGFARDSRIRGAIPLFDRLYRSLGKRKSGCRCRNRRGSLGYILAGVKSAVAKDKGVANKLKSLLNASKLVVHIREGKTIVRKEV